METKPGCVVTAYCTVDILTVSVAVNVEEIGGLFNKMEKMHADILSMSVKLEDSKMHVMKKWSDVSRTYIRKVPITETEIWKCNILGDLCFCTTHLIYESLRNVPLWYDAYNM